MTDLKTAYSLATKWTRYMQSYCEKIEIAGSIRRGKPDVKDIEIVVVPKVWISTDLFGQPTALINLLNQAVDAWAKAGEIKLSKNGDRYKQIILPEGINIDLFCVLPPAQWGVIYTIRTGPADFSKWIVTQRNKGGALPSECQVKEGQVWKYDQPLEMPDELDFLDFIGLGWINPSERKAGSWRSQATR